MGFVTQTIAQVVYTGKLEQSDVPAEGKPIGTLVRHFPEHSEVFPNIAMPWIASPFGLVRGSLLGFVRSARKYISKSRRDPDDPARISKGRELLSYIGHSAVEWLHGP